jgi:predicted tellurium resistance membrane protein TerC
MPTPEDPIYLRLLGAVITAFGVAYWYAYKDPVHNIAIVKAGVVDNGLVTLVTLFFIVFHDLRNITMLISAVLTFVFFISFILLMPKTESA